MDNQDCNKDEVIEGIILRGDSWRHTELLEAEGLKQSIKSGPS